MLRSYFHSCYKKKCFQALFSWDVFIYNERFKHCIAKTGLNAYLVQVNKKLVAIMRQNIME